MDSPLPSSVGAAGHKPVEVAAALLWNDGKLLITRRPAGSHLAGLWEFPGGKREPGETWEQCLARELREELGIEARIGDFMGEVVFPYPAKTVWIRFYRASLVSGEPAAIGCTEVAWVSREELRSRQFPEADEGIRAMLIAGDVPWE